MRTVLMDSHKRSAQVERLEVVETGRRRRWSEDEKLRIVLESLQSAARDIVDSATIRHIAVLADQLAALVPAQSRSIPEGQQTGFVPAMVVAGGRAGSCRRTGERAAW